MLVMGLILVVYEYPITTLDSDQIETLWVFIRLQSFMPRSYGFPAGIALLVGCGHLICMSIMTAESISSIFFESILHTFSTFSSSSTLHRFTLSLSSLFCSFGIGCLLCRQVVFITTEVGKSTSKLHFAYYATSSCSASSLHPSSSRRFFWTSVLLQYSKARWFMLKHCISIFGIPFYVVHFTDFFLGDQLTSHNQTMVDFVHMLFNLFSCSFQWRL